MWAVIAIVILVVLLLVYVVLPALGMSSSVAVPFWLATRRRKGTR
jgi:hypothetical protein